VLLVIQTKLGDGQIFVSREASKHTRSQRLQPITHSS
jgi:hypothetical protein